MWSKRVRAFVSRHKLLPDGGRCLVALSGGADSVALLLLLQDLGYRVEAAHCNFHLRGEESDRDERFCRKLCQSRGVELHLAHFDATTYAQSHGLSIEMAARELRYNWFEQLRQEGFDGVCVAHHRDDSAETVLLNLVRGTGLEGLKGIAPRNGHVVRPLLCLSRGDILKYLESLGQDFVTDSTNLSADTLRNIVRLEVTPLLRKMNPAAMENIARSAERTAAALAVFHAALDSAAGRVTLADPFRISVPTLQKEISPETILWHLLQPRGFSPAQAEEIHASLGTQPGKLWHSPTHTLLLDRDALIVEPRADSSPREMKMPEPGSYVYDAETKFSLTIGDITPDFSPSRDPLCITLDADTIEFPLTLRGCRSGDRFVPFGMMGSRLVSDFLTDRKLSVFRKRRQLVLSDARDRILWLVGLRADNRFRITSDTRKVLHVVRQGASLVR